MALDLSRVPVHGAKCAFRCARCPDPINRGQPYEMRYEEGRGARERWHVTCPREQSREKPGKVAPRNRLPREER